ncbi:MAG: hypothetical protein CM1200mP16_16280 [Nitrospina sp.]|nr:MAG: hypothetical protein CM1200mP16_16280 [Nitrospina sp.]
MLVGCGGSGKYKDDTYIVATDATLAPMSFMSVGNNIIGFEPDLINAIADKGGINIRLVNVEWAGLFGGLITKKFDMIISSVTVLEKRKQRMNFSIPYLKSGLTLVVRKNDKNITSFEDTKNKNALVEPRLEQLLIIFWKKNRP